MIYSINEGVLDKFKNGNTTESEFNDIFANFKKLIQSLENSESKFASSDKSLKRLKEHENNNVEKIKNDFLNGKSSFIVYHMCFKTESSNKDSKIENKQGVVNSVKQFATSCGFKDINLNQNGNMYLEARNSEKYPTLFIQLIIFKHTKLGEMVDIGLFSDRNNCKIKKESAKNESNIILHGEEADSFLESYSITLFTDAIAIGEMVMDGITGEKILAENGITLNEDHIVLEGQQAEEYKARKANDKLSNEYRDREHVKYRNRKSHRQYHDINNRNSDTLDKDMDRDDYTAYIVSKEQRKRWKDVDDASKNINNYFNGVRSEKIKAYDRIDNNQAADAVNRHIRRHPDKYKGRPVWKNGNLVIEESTVFKYANLISE